MKKLRTQALSRAASIACGAGEIRFPESWPNWKLVHLTIRGREKLWGGGSCLYLHAIRCRSPHVKFLAWGDQSPPHTNVWCLTITKQQTIKPNVGSSKNLGRASFRKIPEAGLKIAQKGLKNTFFCQNFPETPSLARVWLGYFGFWGGGLNPPPPDPSPPTCMYALNMASGACSGKFVV